VEAGEFVLLHSWLLVASRIAHAYVRIGANCVPVRRRIFKFGRLVVLTRTSMAIRPVLVS
jgi:hypothetical protein